MMSYTSVIGIPLSVPIARCRAGRSATRPFGSASAAVDTLECLYRTANAADQEQDHEYGDFHDEGVPATALVAGAAMITVLPPGGKDTAAKRMFQALAVVPAE